MDFKTYLNQFLFGYYPYVCLVVFFHLLPNGNAEKIRGPFVLANYLRPALFMALPALVFFLGTTFWIGTATRRPMAELQHAAHHFSR